MQSQQQWNICISGSFSNDKNQDQGNCCSDIADRCHLFLSDLYDIILGQKDSYNGK